MNEETIKDVYDLLVTSLPKLQADLTHIKETSESNKRALRGTNGNPGLVSEVRNLCAEQIKIWKKIEEHDQLLYRGKDENEPGLVDQVREIRKFQKNLGRFYWLIASAVVVGLINIALQFVHLGPPGG